MKGYKTKMKKTIIKSLILTLLTLTFVISLISCNRQIDQGLWENAIYKEDTTLGSGAKAVTVQVTFDEKTVTFTVKTDKDTVGAALLENELITGEDSQYGLYIKSVNGIVADFDVDQSYWAFYIDGEYALSGVDTTQITEGAIYQLVYTK